VSADEVARLVSGPLRRPAHLDLAARLRTLVLDGRLPVAIRLPAERGIADALGISRTTVTAAYDDLRTSGYAVSRVGAGTWTSVPSVPATQSARSGPSALPVWVPSPTRADEIDLAHAAPAAPPQLHRAYVAALADLPRHLPTHGYHPQGLPELRARIAERFTARGLPTTVEQVTVTAGALAAARLALDLAVGPGDRVLVEHPTYPNALDAIRDAGARPVAVPLADGWHASAFADAARQTDPRAAYLQPDFHNPTGVLLPNDERARLSRVLRRAGAVGIVDETMVELALDEPPGEPMATHLPTNAITVGSASKIFWGGLRIGWLRTSADQAQRLAMLRATTDLGSPVMDQLAAAHLIDSLDEVTAHRRRELLDQRDALLAEVARSFPDWAVRPPTGGMVLWCRLPEPIATPLCWAAGQVGLRLTPGSRFAAEPAFENYLRLPYTLPVEDLRVAMQRLAGVAAGVGPWRREQRLRRAEVKQQAVV
jgi:DNA-binding transcriptional MocR family regulator